MGKVRTCQHVQMLFRLPYADLLGLALVAANAACGQNAQRQLTLMRERVCSAGLSCAFASPAGVLPPSPS